MKNATTGKNSKSVAGTDWVSLRKRSAAAVRAAVNSDPDIKPTDASFWEKASVVLPRKKEVVTIRLDADLLELLKQKPRYQTRINAVLRSYMNAG